MVGSQVVLPLRWRAESRRGGNGGVPGGPTSEMEGGVPARWEWWGSRWSYCSREEPIPSPCRKTRFSDSVSITFVIMITHDGLPQRTLPLCLTVKLKTLFQDPVHL